MTPPEEWKQHEDEVNDFIALCLGIPVLLCVIAAVGALLR